MNKGLQHKIEQYKKMANGQVQGKATTQVNERRPDSLTQVIRTKKDADEFMAELEVAAKRK